ncbi:MAG: hypothetical protein AAFV29_21665, partial [Myxococcota bacterium]
LKAFTAQIAIGLENAKLFNDVQAMKNYTESMLESMTNGVVTVHFDETTLATWQIRFRSNVRAHPLLTKAQELRKTDRDAALKMVEAVSQDEDPWLVHEALRYRARWRMELGQTKATEAIYRQMLRHGERLNAPSEQAVNYRRMAYILNRDLDAAETFLKRSKDLSIALGDLAGLARTYRALGLIEHRRRMPDSFIRARQHFDACRTAALRARKPDIAMRCTAYAASTLASYRSIEEARALLRTIDVAATKDILLRVLALNVEYEALALGSLDEAEVEALEREASILLRSKVKPWEVQVLQFLAETQAQARLRQRDILGATASLAAIRRLSAHDTETPNPTLALLEAEVALVRGHHDQVIKHLSPLLVQDRALLTEEFLRATLFEAEALYEQGHVARGPLHEGGHTIIQGAQS